MRKRIVLPILLLCLVASAFVEIKIVKASAEVIVDQPSQWQRVIGVNQPTAFNASGSGGSPPYTFQWYTTFLDPNVNPDLWVRVAVPGATSSTYQFVASTTGRYGISISIYDANGDGEYQSFQPMGIMVTVQSTPVPSLSPTPLPQNISVLSQQNKTYAETTVPLNFSLTQPAQWIAYSLDGQANITITGNMTLTALSNGQHTVIIYANDAYGNAAEPQTETFAVNVPAPFPTVEVSVATIIVIVGIAVALVFVIKRKHAPK